MDFLQKDQDRSGDKDNSLRREPTPFPKEMRAMAKRAKQIREQQQQPEAQPQQQQQQQQQVVERKKGKEYRPRMQRKSSASNESEDKSGDHQNGFVEIREAKVTSSNTTSGMSQMSGSESLEMATLNESSPAKMTTFNETIKSARISNNFDVAMKFSTANGKVSTTNEPVPTFAEVCEEQVELSQFEALEKALGVVTENNDDQGYR